jgi:hypothetical protein
MPATSEKQKKFMDAVAHNPAFAKKAGVSQSVGKEFSEASKGMKFGKDRSVSTRADRQVVNRPKTNQGKAEFFKKGGEMKESKAMVKKEVSLMKAKGAPKSMVKHEMKEAGMKKMAGGGMPMVTKDGQKVPAFAADGKGKMAKGGITSAKMGKVPSGGNKGKGEHAIQKSGISKGTMVKMSGPKPLGMKKGGKAYC